MHIDISEIAGDFPDFRVAVVVAERIEIEPGRTPELAALIAEREAACRAAWGGMELSEIPGVAAWRKAYRAFGIKKIAQAMTDDEFEAHLKNVPIPEQQLKWRRARNGFPQEILDEEFRKVGVSVQRLEETLSKQDYLLETGFSLADICNFAIANGMQREGGFFPEQVNEKATPGLIAWIDRINARPAIQKMFAEAKREEILKHTEKETAA